MNKLDLDRGSIARCRELAGAVARDVQAHIDRRSTVSVERSMLRLCGVDGADRFEVPLSNLMVEEVREKGDLSLGVSRYLAGALKAAGLPLEAFCEAYLAGGAALTGHPLPDAAESRRILAPYLEAGFSQIARQRAHREAQLEKYGSPRQELYVIVATGNIHEDVLQAQAAAEAGADVIAVIRSTGQSLLDYVPQGATTQGFGGTYATRENFRIMRAALDETGEGLHRYVKLVNYASGLCMPEIAALGALERLDMMLNDSMYGIIFRDINMQRTFVDQYFSRCLSAAAGITINTGEDNYLTTADAAQSAHTVLASQFINEAFARIAGMPERLMGLGHAFEIDPMLPDSFLWEIAQAQMAREIFPEAPLKYMPPTKHSTGNIFQTQALDTLFNAASVMTGQSIHLLAMMTEAIHTPFLSDRHLAIRNARMVQTALGSIHEEISFAPGGKVRQRAHRVLAMAEELLGEISSGGLFDALERGVFADIRRPREGGKGREGVFLKHADYANAAMDKLQEVLHANQALR